MPTDTQQVPAAQATPSGERPTPTLIEVNFRNQIGANITIKKSITNNKDILTLLRSFGAAGWSSIVLPPKGGLVLPKSMEETFDWSLLGATKITLPDNESGVLYLGKCYKRRVLPANKKYDLGEDIRYSRGANDNDPTSIIEKGDGDTKFVTLVTFRGNARPIQAFCKPQ